MSYFTSSINFEDKPFFASLHRDSVLPDFENSDDPILTLKVRQVYYEYTKKVLESNASETGIHISHDVIVNVAREIELLALRMCMSSSLYREIMISKIDHIKYLTMDKYAVFSTAKDNSESSTVRPEELGISEPNTINQKLRESRLNMYFERFSPSVSDLIYKYTPNGSKNKSFTCLSNNSDIETGDCNSESDCKGRKPNIVEDLSENKEPDKIEIISEIQQPDISPEIKPIVDDSENKNQQIDEIMDAETQDMFQGTENQTPIKVEVETLQDEIQDQAQIPIKIEDNFDSDETQTPIRVEDNTDVFNKVYNEMSKLFEQDPPENNAMSETSSNPVSDKFFSCADKNFWYMEHVINESKTDQNLSAKYDLNEKKYENTMNRIENLLGPGDFIVYSIKEKSHVCKKRIAWHVRNSLSVYYKRKYFRSVDEFRILAKNIVSKLQGIDPYIDYKLIYRAISKAFYKKRIIVETLSQIQSIVMKVAEYVIQAKT